MPDSVHVCKSLIQGWITNRIIEIDKRIVEVNGLITPVADIDHLRELVVYEQDCDLRMACGLKLEDVDFSKSTSNFEKMKVKNSTKYASHAVAAALRIFGKETGRTDVLTTAFLIDQIASWFSYMTTRSIQLAFSLKNENAYAKAISSMNTFRSIIYSCKVGAEGRNKPWQSAVVMATDSILRLQECFLRDHGYDFFLGGRLTQDSLENVFSQLRSRQIRPNALQVKDSLKLLTVSQYLNDIATTSYEWDEGSWLLEFPNQVASSSADGVITADDALESSATREEELLSDEDMIEECNVLCNRSSEQNVIYYLSGMVMRQIARQSRVCMNCVNSCIATGIPMDDVAFFTQLRDYTGNALTYVNVDTFNFFTELEETFKMNIDQLKVINVDLHKKLYELMTTIPALHMPECHSIRTKIINKYILFRLRISRVNTPREKRKDSKSMAI